MNILFITSSLLQKRNSAAIRNNALIEGLRNIGHNVYIETFMPPIYNRSTFFCENAGIINTDYCVSPSPQNNKSAFQIFVNNRHKLKTLVKLFSYFVFPDMSIFDWFLRPIHAIVENIKIDLIISSSDSKSSHFIARTLKKKYPHSKWIQIWGDPWSNDISLKVTHKILALYYEKHLIRQSDLAFFISQFTAEKMRLKYPELTPKIRFLPRSYYKTIIKNNKSENNNILKLMYPGSLNKDRNLLQLAQCFETFNKTSIIKIHLCIYSPNSEFKEFYKNYSCVSFNYSLEYFDLLEEFKKMDAFIFLENKGNSGQIPGKLFDYLGTNLPIICLMRKKYGNETWNFLNKKKNCYCIEYNKETIQKNLHKLVGFCQKLYCPDSYYSPDNVAKLLIDNLS